MDTHLAAKQAKPRCGLQVIDLRTGDSPHWVRLSGTVDELYDVAVLPEAALPKAIGFQTDEVRHHVWCENEDGTATSWSGSSDGR